MTLQIAPTSRTIRKKPGIPSRKRFFIPVMPSNADGTISADCDFVDGAYKSLTAAASMAKEIVDEHGGEFVIYEAVPIAVVTERGVKELPGGKRAFRTATGTPG